jgi:hypothetical protein
MPTALPSTSFGGVESLDPTSPSGTSYALPKNWGRSITCVAEEEEEEEEKEQEQESERRRSRRRRKKRMKKRRRRRSERRRGGLLHKGNTNIIPNKFIPSI